MLLAKKRYVGFKYEAVDDMEPVFDAKGIETVRRDGVLAQRKMVENCIKYECDSCYLAAFWLNDGITESCFVRRI